VHQAFLMRAFGHKQSSDRITMWIPESLSLDIGHSAFDILRFTRLPKESGILRIVRAKGD
jgi:hypothetical protein